MNTSIFKRLYIITLLSFFSGFIFAGNSCSVGTGDDKSTMQSEFENWGSKSNVIIVKNPAKFIDKIIGPDLKTKFKHVCLACESYWELAKKKNDAKWAKIVLGDQKEIDETKEIINDEIDKIKKEEIRFIGEIKSKIKGNSDKVERLTLKTKKKVDKMIDEIKNSEAGSLLNPLTEFNVGKWPFECKKNDLSKDVKKFYQKKIHAVSNIVIDLKHRALAYEAYDQFCGFIFSKIVEYFKKKTILFKNNDPEFKGKDVSEHCGVSFDCARELYQEYSGLAKDIIMLIAKKQKESAAKLS